MSADARVCHHEAGHSVMALLLGVHFDRVSVYRPGTHDVLGEVTGFRPCPPITDFAIDFAGPASEALFLGGFQAGDDPIVAWRTGLERADISTWSTDIEAMRALKWGLL